MTQHTCHDCRWSHTFNARPDERERYGFGATGYGCKHSVDGGVYVTNPDQPTCLPSSHAHREQSA
jgi:hypothetical protein